MKRTPWILIALLLFLIGASACREEKRIDVASKLNPKKMPTMRTVNVATFVSDSGVVQYKIVSPLWLIYDEADTPYWSFPKGIYLRKFDRNFNVESSVAADSAKFFKNEKIWRLDGRVELTKAPKGLFQTEQLFWDQRHGKLYSDSFIHIETETHVLEGYGFQSDEKLTSYRVTRPQAIFPINGASLTGGATGASGASAGAVPSLPPGVQPTAGGAITTQQPIVTQ